MKKKGIIIALFTVCSFVLFGCGGEANSSKKNNSANSSSSSSVEVNNDIIDVLSINDTHGYLESSSSNSIAKIAKYMSMYPDSLKIAVGDMFQGTGLSNLSKGKAMIDVMNEMKIDAMVIGNHEFDWGIDTILAYFDGDSTNGEANFPLLAANVVNASGESLSNTSPYTIIDRSETKIGVIGVIGDTLESSISVSSLGGYEFLPTGPIVREYTTKLRNELDCDVVILATHCGSESNTVYSGLDIDLIINAHTHQSEENMTGIPSIQASSYARYVAHVKLDMSKIKKVVSLNNVSISRIDSSSLAVENIVEYYQDSLSDILESNVTTVQNYSKSALINYACEVYREKYDVDMAFVNSGGFRTNWYDGKIVKYNDMITMFPFDNELKTVKMSGKLIKKLIDLMESGKDISTSSALYKSGDTYYFNNTEITEDTIYSVVAIDYIFDKEEYPFLSGTEITHTTTYMRDILLEALQANEITDLEK